ncbi:SDR family oxidoreductase [Bacteroidota bacterium]
MIIVSGGSGFLGSHFLCTLQHQDKELVNLDNNNVISFDFSENITCDIRSYNEVLKFAKFNPDLIVHCAAMTNINACEMNPDLAYEVNVKGSENIAKLAQMSGAKLVYISTDAVFSGNELIYDETSPTNPISIYGKTKLEGEKICMELCPDSLIIRTHLFGVNFVSDNKTFFQNVMSLIEEKKVFNGFIDAYCCPISATELIRIILKLVAEKLNGIFNIVSNETLSKYQFAKLIASNFNGDLKLIQKSSLEQLPNKEIYAKNLSLKNDKVKNCLQEQIPSIEQMLSFYLRMIDTFYKPNLL